MGMGIHKDFATGNTGEEIVTKILSKAGYVVAKNKDVETRQLYDLYTDDFTLEIKYDVYSERSGNIAIEFNNSRKKKPSGINVTTADLWVQVTPKQGSWLTSVAKLKDYISTHKPFRTIQSGGDGNADMYLYKANEILSSIFIRFDKLSKTELRKVINSMVYNNE